ncbi:MAG: LysR family transcriptional regulator [Ruminococcus sp.]|nr:LysR family transcriptional regulator [Ruminococcus sp.]
MDSIQLKCFISVARTLSFSEAARRNYVSQSTVSRYIRDLEKEFGVKLFERSRREVELTNEGKLLLPYIQDVIDTLNKATSVVSQLNNGRGGRLRLAYDAASVDFPVKCLKRFTKSYPDIAVDMVRLSGSDITSALSSSEFDFFFMLRDMLPDNDNLNSEITSKDKLSLLVPSDYEVKGNSVDGVSLKNSKFVLLSESESPILYMEIMDIFRTFHFSPDSVTEYDDARSVFMAVSSGMGISILPSQLIGGYSNPSVKSLDFKGIETDLTYVLAWRKDNSNPAAHLFLNTVKRDSKAEDEDEYVI